MHVNLCHKVPCVVELSPAVRLVSIGRVKVGHRVGSMREYSLLVWLWAKQYLMVLQDFSPLQRSLLPALFLGPVVSAAFRSLTSSSHVVLG